MHGKAANRTLERIIEVEVVEQQEWIVFIGSVRGNGPAQHNARAIDNVLRFNDMGNGSTGYIARGSCVIHARHRWFTLLIAHDEFSALFPTNPLRQ